MKPTDILGRTVETGETVAVDVMSYKTSRLQVGTVKAVGEQFVDITYQVTDWRGNPGRVVTVSRRSGGFVKVAPL